MTTFEELYNRLVKASLNGNIDDEIKKLRQDGYSENQLDCLLNPKKYAPVLKWGKCECSDKKDNCHNKCEFGAFKESENGEIEIDKDKCIGCMKCIEVCKEKNFKSAREILPVLEAIRASKGPVYAIIAPAFIGQFSSDVTPGKLRSAFKSLGFEGMIEVALFADILTLKEALEFDRNIKTEQDFQLTSCCCPMWIGMIKKVYSKLVSHIPASVSPMIACGRAVKKLHPHAITVFIGPCLAKRAEAREPDIADAVDYVLTFKEVQDLFSIAGIDPSKFDDIDKEHSSRAGRIYARTGGVSEAVVKTVEKIRRNSNVKVKPVKANGVPECKKMLNNILEGKVEGNFFEGMGCVGGCVGGPRAIIDRQEGKKHVDSYGNEAKYDTPIDNPYVIELLHRLGFDSVESLLEDNELFTRKWIE